MSVLDRLDEFIRGEDEAISEMAKMSVRARRLRDADVIDEHQFDDLVRSIKRMYEIEKSASSIIRKQQLKEAMEVLSSFLGIVSSFK